MIGKTGAQASACGVSDTARGCGVGTRVLLLGKGIREVDRWKFGWRGVWVWRGGGGGRCIFGLDDFAYDFELKRMVCDLF